MDDATATLLYVYIKYIKEKSLYIKGNPSTRHVVIPFPLHI